MGNSYLYIPVDAAASATFDLDELGTMPWVSPVGWCNHHITFVFLGQLTPEQDESVLYRLPFVIGSTMARLPEVRLKGVGYFTGSQSLHASVETSHAMYSVQQGVKNSLRGMGLPPVRDYGDWTPHVTLAYITSREYAFSRSSSIIDWMFRHRADTSPWWRPQLKYRRSNGTTVDILPSPPNT